MRMSVIWRKPLAEDLHNQPGITIISGKVAMQNNVRYFNLLRMDTICNTLRKAVPFEILDIIKDMHTPFTFRSASLFLNCMKKLLLFSKA